MMPKLVGISEAMAGEEEAYKILIELGISELSMAPSLISQAKKISEPNSKEMKKLTDKELDSETAKQVKQLIK